MSIKRVIYYTKRWVTILFAGNPSNSQICVSYGYQRIPTNSDPVRGGMVKFVRLQSLLPNSPNQFNIIYLGSSSLPKDWKQQLYLAKWKDAKVILNQNGVGYPAWCGQQYKTINHSMSIILHNADYVFYQSQFCKLAADTFLGERKEGWEILYNAVDTRFFCPSRSNLPTKPLVLLLGGNQYQQYRIELALRTLFHVVQKRKATKLVIAGQLNWTKDQEASTKAIVELITQLKLDEHVEFCGQFTQKEAPSLYQKAHILLHTKYNDPCPSTVIEAMACGLPVVYSDSGGTPELVGADAGIGVRTELSWERDYLPDPITMAESILKVEEQLCEFADAARQRAVEKFDLQPWIQRHKEVFASLLQ